MARIYGPIWEKIKVEQKAEVTTGKDRAATIIQGVKKVKSEENAARKAVGIVSWSKLGIKVESLDSIGTVKITFWLIYDTRL